MPLTLVAPTLAAPLPSLRERRLRPGTRADRGRRLTIGLVNNMPDAAVSATQRQFASLLEDGAGEFDLSLTLWTLQSVGRADEARRDMARHYRPAQALRQAMPDALILTGAEPRAARLEDEPYWEELTGLVDRARGEVHSLMASCLAAHAVTQHQDGVRRRRLAQKRSGVFAVERALRHPLNEGMPRHVGVPHSRWNDLDEGELTARGYLILGRSAEAGVDAFVKEGPHLQVFLQGHPEYEADTLAREYRRDVLRALAGHGVPPAPPEHYFPPEVAEALRAFVAAAAADPGRAAFPAEALERTRAPWRAASVLLFRNWLALVAARKAAASPPSFTRARWGG